MIQTITKQIRKFFNLFGYEIFKTKDISPTFTIVSWIKRLNINTVIDVGSNEGQFIQSFQKILPDPKIIAFEPIKSVYDTLLINTKKLNITAHNVGLSDYEGNVEINVSKNFVSSSILSMEEIHKKTYKESEYVKKESIQLKRLDDVLDISDLRDNVLLKIDVQGYEDKVIAGGSKVIKHVAVVIIEFSFTPIYKGQWLFDDTYKYFTSNGFKLIGFADQVSGFEAKVPLYGDAIFVKENLAKLLYE